jgi:SAM-dependent methyltransferase
MLTAYDQVRYPGRPYPQCDPAAFGVMARLCGLVPAPVERARVLEIGCGDGVHLVNLALSWPQARFVGVDLAPTAIALAREDAAACGLSNVEFHAADLRDIGASYGQFDYVIAHGVLSWIPECVRAEFFRVVGERLAPGGVAMASFAALPGAHTWLAMRDLLHYETRDAATPAEKLARARALVESCLGLWSETNADTAHMIGAARRILERAPETLFHDELSEAYRPQLLADVAAAAGAQGLNYLCDARPNAMGEILFPSESSAYARARGGEDFARVQQYLDFRDMRSFHNALFVKGGAPDRRRVDERLAGLWMQGDFRETGAGAFSGPGGVRLTTDDPDLVARLRGLGAAFPEAVQLAGGGEAVLKLYVGGVARLSTAPPDVVRDPGARPLARALARRQAERGEREFATGLQTVSRLEDDPLIALMRLCDGTRARETLAADWASAAGLDAGRTAEALDGALVVLARAGLLMRR